MQCPHCLNPLSTMNLVGYPTSYCRKCEGSWIAGSDIEQRASGDPIGVQAIAQLKARMAKGLPTNELKCPSCSKPLSPMRVFDSEVDLCCSCGGAFLNFDRVRAAAPSLPAGGTEWSVGETVAAHSVELLLYLALGLALK